MNICRRIVTRQPFLLRLLVHVLAIWGHLTERMQHHYSIVNGGEQRDALAKVVRLLNAPTPAAASAPSPGEGGEGRSGDGEETKKAG